MSKELNHLVQWCLRSCQILCHNRTVYGPSHFHFDTWRSHLHLCRSWVISSCYVVLITAVSSIGFSAQLRGSSFIAFSHVASFSQFKKRYLNPSSPFTLLWGSSCTHFQWNRKQRKRESRTLSENSCRHKDLHWLEIEANTHKWGKRGPVGNF